MTGTRPAELLRHLEQPVADDRALVNRYASHNDQAAFAELVRRHGPLVWAACLRVAGHRQDAEDAFQAAFLVLVRRCAAIRDPDLLGNWLYGVAVRVALKARRTAARRRAREVQVHPMPEPPARNSGGLTSPGSPEHGDLGTVLDEELAVLPAWYRDAVVLCDLRGVSREEAARLLGVPEGTLSSRLANGRKRLAARLAKRGVALSVAAIPAVLGQAARATVPAELVSKVIHASTGAAVPATVARLATGGYSVKTSLFLGVACAAAVAGAVFATGPFDVPSDPPKPPVAAQKPDAGPQPAPEPAPKPADKLEVAYTTSPRLVGVSDLNISDVFDVIWSADGTSLAVVGLESPEIKGRRSVYYLLKYPVKAEQQNRTRTILPKNNHFVGFSPDGKQAITDAREHDLLSGFHRLTYWDPSRAEPPPGGLWPKVGEERTLRDDAKVRTVDFDGAEMSGYAFSRDGKTFRTMRPVRDPKGFANTLEIVEVDAASGKTGKSLLQFEHGRERLSPDGKRLAVVDKEATNVTIHDVDRGAKHSEYKFPAENPLNSVYAAMVFSPDGSRLVVYGRGRTVVLNTETGEVLPALEGLTMARALPEYSHAFSGDGHLLALTWEEYPPPKRKGGGVGGSSNPNDFAPRPKGLIVWDTRTGKVLKSWHRAPRVAFCPTRPILAIVEPNGPEDTRVGFWDFSAEVEKK